MLKGILTHQELNLKVGVKAVILFNLPKSLAIRDTHLATSCGCTEARYVDNTYVDGNQRYISVSYIPSAIPYHLKSQGYYETFKTITALLHMEDGTTEELKLSFQATIKP
jgi:hypothetical protein